MSYDQNMEGAGFFIYMGVKFAAYVGWCTLGLKLHGQTTRIALKGLLWGIVRLMMGMVFGLVAIFFLANVVFQASHNSVATYASVYVPVRWIEWSLMAIFFDHGHRTLKSFLGGSSRASVGWKVGGIVISCLADIPMMLSIGGLPIGRFMC